MSCFKRITFFALLSSTVRCEALSDLFPTSTFIMSFDAICPIEKIIINIDSCLI